MKLVIALLMGAIAISLCVPAFGIVDTDSVKGFDFGTSSSPCKSGYTNLTAADVYTEVIGYGFSETWTSSVDRGAGDDMQRDFVYTNTNRSFLVAVVDGTYRVTVTMGDKDFGHDDMILIIEGTVVDSDIDVAAEEWYVQVADVDVTDGVLSIGFSYNDAAGTLALVNGIVVQGIGEVKSDREWFQFLIVIVMFLVLLALTVFPRVPIVNFVLGVIGLGISAATLSSTVLPYTPYVNILLSVMATLCIVSAAYKMRGM